MKELLLDLVKSEADALVQIADEIFDNPELGFKEYYACKLLTDYLRKHDYHVETGIGGLDTAFRAVYQNGEGGVSIGLLCEYDALPMGHACGHHLQGPIMLMVAQAIRKANLQTPYKLVIYGTPGEEGMQGKYLMLENGCFRDIDIALMTHASPNTTVDIKSLSGSTWDISFKGVAAHPSISPELVRSPVDAVILAFSGMEFLKSHTKEDVRFQSTITSCQGTNGHTDPAAAYCSVALRTYQHEDIPELEERMINVMKGAALMTGTTVTYSRKKKIWGKIPSHSLNKVIMDNAASLDSPQMLPYRKRTGSTDFDIITQIMPGAVSRFALVPPGNTSHSQAFLDYGKGENARKGMISGASILAYTVYDIISDSELVHRVKAEFLSYEKSYFLKDA